MFYIIQMKINLSEAETRAEEATSKIDGLNSRLNNLQGELLMAEDNAKMVHSRIASIVASG